MFALALILSVLGLALGPVLVFAGRGRALISAAVEGLTLGLVPLLIVLRLLPHVMEELGFAGLLLCGAGYGGLWLIDRKRHELGDRVGISVLIPALALHALTDGAALGLVFAGAGEHQSAGMLAGLAVLVHRMPEGLLIATRFVPLFGWGKTLLWLALLAGATLLGAFAGQGLEGKLPETLFDSVVALGLGAMLRLSAHVHAPPEHGKGPVRMSGLGFVVGVALALLIPAEDGLLSLARPGELSPQELVVPLFVKSAPFLAAGLLLSLILSLRGAKSKHHGADLPDSPLAAMFRGMLHPARSGQWLWHSLVHERKAAAWLSFGVASAGLDMTGVMISIPLLGPRLGIARFGLLMFSLGCLLVLLVVLKPVERVEQEQGHAHENENAPLPSLGSRVWEAWQAILSPVGVWILFGISLAALLEAHFPASIAGFASMYLPGAWSGLGILLGALLGAVLAFPTVAAVLIAMILLHKGFSPGTALAFLLAGPISGLGLYAAIRRRFGQGGARTSGLIWGFGLLLSVGMGGLYDRVVEQRGVPELHPLAHEPMGIVSIGVALLLLVGMAASVLSVGPRAFLSVVVTAVMGPGAKHRHEHEHHGSGPEPKASFDHPG